MPPAVYSAFDVAFWFADTALNDNEYLQPQKMHRLLFLAQAYYAVAFAGRMLMPAVFVADEMGPIEPNLFAAFSRGRPNIDSNMFLPTEVESFLDSVWRRFGHHSVDRLTRMTKESSAFKHAYAKGKRSEITLEAMRLAFTRVEEAPSVDQVVRPKLMRTQSGKAVAVKQWSPRPADPEDLRKSGNATTQPRVQQWIPGTVKPMTGKYPKIKES